MNRRLWIALLAITWMISATAHEGYKPQAQQKLNRLTKNLDQATNMVATSGSFHPAEARNDIDRLTFAKMQADGVPVNELSDDGTFLRRLSLLLTGRLPDPARTRAFLADTNPEKRAALIDETLASEAFNTYWAFWFQEYFQANSFILRAGLPYYNQFLADSVRNGVNLDDMARTMMTATGLTDEIGPANFAIRASENVRGAQDFWDNMAVHAADKFLGLPLACISCHDGAYHLEDINLYLADRKREDLWKMAAYFSGLQRRRGTTTETALRSFDVQRVDTTGYLAETDSGDRPVRDGGLVQPAFILDGATPTSNDWLGSFADKVTNNRQFARNWANRLWGHLFGLAMVEPMDSFDPYRIDPARTLPEGWTRQALDLNLLKHMTDQMIAFDYNLRDFLRYVLNASTFQMSSTWRAATPWQETYAPYYTRFLARRMDAETVYDAIISATGVEGQLTQVTQEDTTQVTYAHELMEPAQPRGRRNVDVRQFLAAFGRGNRYDQFRNNDGDISQALMLMNSEVVQSRFLNADNRLFDYLDQGLALDAIIGELFMDLYCREPSTEEVQTFLAELANFESDVDKVTTVQWLLLNKTAFVFIY